MYTSLTNKVKYEFNREIEQDAKKIKNVNIQWKYL
jgi:hypothetical protein